MTNDQSKSTDAAADDACIPAVCSDECARGEHDGANGERSGCSGIDDASGIVCGCECHGPPEAYGVMAVPCQCRQCGAAFTALYLSYLCDGCLAKPFEVPKGVFE